MIKIKTNRVLGARGIALNNGNYNNDFNGQPKTLQDGTFMCSDVCTKYADRLFWENFNQPVLIQKKLKRDKNGKLYAATQDEIIADNIVDSKNSNTEILSNFIDVQNFGVTVATKGISLGTTGVVQYTQGINKVDDSTIEVHQILSPYGTGNNKKNKKNDEKNDKQDEKSKTATNIGSHIFLDKALYVQGFSVTPSNLNNLVEVLGDKQFKGYKEESFELFKKATLCSTTLLSTRNKEGVCDAFSIFINLKEGSIFAFNNIHNYISVNTVADNFYTIDFSELDFLNDINDIDDIESIEIYHNPKICEIKHNFNNVKVMNSLKCL